MINTTDSRRVRIRRRSWARILLPAVLIIAWVVGAGLGGPLFGKVSEVSSNDQTSYLPSSADATEVQQLLGEFNDSDAIPSIVVFVGDSELDDDQLTHIEEAIAATPDIEGVSDEVSPAIPSEDGKAVQAFIPISSDADLGDTVSALEEALQDASPQGVRVYVTGPAG